MRNAILVCTLFAFAACSPKPQNAAQSQTAFELLQSGTFWTLVFGDAFADGGSLALSFINHDGEILHVWAQAQRNATSSKRQFFLKRTYNDPQSVEITPGSAIEQRVIELLTSYRRRSYVNIPDTYANRFIAMLRNRELPFPSLEEWATPLK